MSYLINGKFFLVCEGDTERASAGLAAWGIALDLKDTSGIDDHFSIQVEVRDVPIIIAQMDTPKPLDWDIVCVSPAGVVLYGVLTSKDDGSASELGADDGHIFIPSANIIAIHTLDAKRIERQMRYRSWREAQR